MLKKLSLQKNYSTFVGILINDKFIFYFYVNPGNATRSFSIATGTHLSYNIIFTSFIVTNSRLMSRNCKKKKVVTNFFPVFVNVFGRGEIEFTLLTESCRN